MPVMGGSDSLVYRAGPGRAGPGRAGPGRGAHVETRAIARARARAETLAHFAAA
jgi:hypothetical protein